MLKCDQPRGKEVADLPPKGPQKQSANRRGQKTMTMMMMMMVMIKNTFFFFLILRFLCVFENFVIKFYHEKALHQMN